MRQLFPTKGFSVASASSGTPVDCMEFAVDTTTMVAKAASAAGIEYFAPVFDLLTNTAFTMSGQSTANIYMWAFAVDTTAAVVKGACSTSRTNGVAGFNSGLSGYATGGFQGSALSSTDSFSFAVNTANTVAKGALSSARYANGGLVGGWS